MTIAGRLLHGEFGFSHKALLRHKPENYLLLDRFGDARAAGSVNGTPAEPGPGGNRLIRDVEGKISIVGGVETWAAQATPGLYTEQDRVYSQLPITRAFGVLAICKYRISTIDNHFPLAFVNSITPSWGSYANVDAGIYHDINNFQIVYNFTGGPLMPDLATGIDYLLAIELRVAGAKWFIKGGAYTSWTKLFEHTLGTASPLYIATSNLVGVFTLDDMRSPARKFYDVPLASDSFNRANGVLGNTDGAGHAEANGGSGKTWTDQVGTWAVLTNAAAASVLSGGLAIATVPTASADVLIDVEATRSAGNVGGIARFADSSNYLNFYHDGTNAICVKVVAGTPTTLRTAAATYSAGAIIRLITDNVTGRLFYNSAAVGASFTIPASTSKNHGLYTTNTGNSLDDFVISARGTGGEYEGLNQF